MQVKTHMSKCHVGNGMSVIGHSFLWKALLEEHGPVITYLVNLKYAGIYNSCTGKIIFLV